MTTIAANKNSIACDLQFTHSSGLKFKGKSKILKLSTEMSESLFGADKAFIGFCGSGDTWGNVVHWLIVPEGKPPRCRDIEFLALDSNKNIYHGTNLSNWMIIAEPFFSIGSGMQYAIGALTAGKTPKEAIKVASKHDPMTGMGFHEYTI